MSESDITIQDAMQALRNAVPNLSQTRIVISCTELWSSLGASGMDHGPNWSVTVSERLLGAKADLWILRESASRLKYAVSAMLVMLAKKGEEEKK